MRARAGDPPRTMAQKILEVRSSVPLSRGSRGSGPGEPGDLVEVAVDQIVLARSPMRAFKAALAAGLKKTAAEIAVAYDGRCVTGGPRADEPAATSPEMPAHGVLVARAGVGFAGPVHLERFASPARLCVTDEPRAGSTGGIGMLTLVVPGPSLARALASGSVMVRVPVSLQVLLAGRLRPFVCARDLALELLRRGLAEAVRHVEEARGAPVVVEFAGPGVRGLSVGERSVLAALAPRIGAAAALFVSDERTEVFLRDQRRSKAHRALAPDAGAPCEEVIAVDLGAVDPLLLDGGGHVRSVRDLAGQTVTQVLLGGDCGATLRDFFATAMLLKSKRVPSRLEFLVATPSRQMLEVLAQSGALTDLIATGARLVEPDARIAWGTLYAPPVGGVSMRTCDPEPRMPGAPPQGSFIVASAETLALAVATGEVGDPRSFKRPVRVTVPRVLPTDDVLVTRKAERTHASSSASPSSETRKLDGGVAPWRAAQTLDLVEGADLPTTPAESSNGGGVALVCASLDEVRDIAGRAADVSHSVRAVLAPYIPSSLVALLSAAGIAAFRLDPAVASALVGQQTITLPPPKQWAERQATTVSIGPTTLPLTWLALGEERAWAMGATGATGGVGAAGAVAKTAATRGQVTR
jgi:aconitate hydratase